MVKASSIYCCSVSDILLHKCLFHGVIYKRTFGLNLNFEIRWDNR